MRTFVAVLMMVVTAQAVEPLPVARAELVIATVDLNQVQENVGYENLRLLSADATVRAKLKELRTQHAAITAKTIAATNQDELNALSEQNSLVQQKEQALVNMITDQSNGDRQIRAWIRKNFATRYDLILDAQQRDQAFILKNGKMVDITDDVIVALTAELHD